MEGHFDASSSHVSFLFNSNCRTIFMSCVLKIKYYYHFINAQLMYLDVYY